MVYLGHQWSSVIMEEFRTLFLSDQDLFDLRNPEIPPDLAVQSVPEQGEVQFNEPVPLPEASLPAPAPADLSLNPSLHTEHQEFDRLAHATLHQTVEEERVRFDS